MEVVRRGASAQDSIVPMDTDNQMALEDALNIVNGILATNFRAFDKLRSVLDAAKQAVTDVAVSKEQLAAVQADIATASNDLANLVKQKSAAQLGITQAQSKFGAQLSAQQDQLAKQAQDAKDALLAELQDMKDKAASQLTSDMQATTDALASIKVQLASVQAQTKDAQKQLADVAKQLAGKQQELADTNDRLEKANAALAALKAKL